MRATINHIKLNVKELEFYKSLLGYLEFEFLYDFKNGFGAANDGIHIFVFKTEAGHEKEINFKDTGLNHLAFEVESRQDVNKFHQEFLLAKNIPLLHEPREYKEYNNGKGYYAVFFESPDHLKLEVMHKA